MSTTTNKIAFAVYGVGQYNNGRESCMEVDQRTVDVTVWVKALWGLITTFPFHFQITTENLLVPMDPAPGVPKYFTVFYTDSTPADCVAEGDTWIMTELGEVIPAIPCEHPAGQLRAYWGIPHGWLQMVDVTAQIWQTAQHSLTIAPLQSWFTPRGVLDPAPGQVKTLLVMWTDCMSQGQGTSGPIQEGSTFVLPAGFWPK